MKYSIATRAHLYNRKLAYSGLSTGSFTSQIVRAPANPVYGKCKSDGFFDQRKRWLAADLQNFEERTGLNGV